MYKLNFSFVFASPENLNEEQKRRLVMDSKLDGRFIKKHIFSIYNALIKFKRFYIFKIYKEMKGIKNLLCFQIQNLKFFFSRC